MFYTPFLHIEESDRTALTAAGLDSYDALMHGEVGELLAKSKTRELRRVRIGDKLAYLKRTGTDHPLKLLAMVLRGSRPMSAAMREAAMLQSLHGAGLAAARPIAWGGQRRLGLPGKGFILTRAVEGREFHELFTSAGARARAALAGEIGKLLGTLHAKGFFHILRLKDVIVSPQGKLVMIDREVAFPWPRRFTRGRCVVGLARCQAKFLRAGYEWDARQLAVLLRNYREAVAPKWAVSRRELTRRVAQKLGAIAGDERYRAIRAEVEG